MDPRAYFLNRAINGIFFDFDGVLADSVEIKSRAFARLFEECGPGIMQQIMEHHRGHGGMTRTEKFEHYYQNLLQRTLSEGELNDLCYRFSCLVVDQVVAAPEIPGAEAFLSRHEKTTPCFVVSAMPEAELHEILKRRNWARYFRDLRGAPACKEDNIQDLLSKYALSPADCIFFGDSESDYRAARHAAIPFLGIVRSPESPLLKCDPPVIWVDNFNALLAGTPT